MYLFDTVSNNQIYLKKNIFSKTLTRLRRPTSREALGFFWSSGRRSLIFLWHIFLWYNII